MLLTFLASGGGALLGGLLGAFGGWVAARLTSKTARRDQVWKRVEWALSLVLQDSERAQQLGYVTLLEIIQGGLADKRDVKIITSLATAAFEDLENEADVDSADFVVLPSGEDGLPSAIEPSIADDSQHDDTRQGPAGGAGPDGA